MASTGHLLTAVRPTFIPTSDRSDAVTAYAAPTEEVKLSRLTESAIKRTSESQEAEKVLVG